VKEPIELNSEILLEAPKPQNCQECLGKNKLLERAANRILEFFQSQQEFANKMMHKDGKLSQMKDKV